MITGKRKLHDMKEKYGLLEKIYCDEEERRKLHAMQQERKQLPSDINVDDENPFFFYRVKEADLTEKEFDEFLKFYQLTYLRKIKNGVIFFVVLTVISLILSLISAITLLSSL